MSVLSIIKLFPNLLKKAKIWEYEFDKKWYFGTGNQSGTLRFTSHHDPNNSVINLINLINNHLNKN